MSLEAKYLGSVHQFSTTDLQGPQSALPHELADRLSGYAAQPRGLGL